MNSNRDHETSQVNNYENADEEEIGRVHNSGMLMSFWGVSSILYKSSSICQSTHCLSITKIPVLLTINFLILCIKLAFGVSRKVNFFDLGKYILDQIG